MKKQTGITTKTGLTAGEGALDQPWVRRLNTSTGDFNADPGTNEDWEIAADELYRLLRRYNISTDKLVYLLNRFGFGSML